MNRCYLNEVPQRIVLPAAYSHPAPEISYVLIPPSPNNHVTAAPAINLGTAEARRVNIMRKLTLDTLEELNRFTISRRTTYTHSIPRL